MQIRFLLGPAGSGKTSRCVEEIRSILVDAPEGLPLILLAPKQATFQLERRLLGSSGLAGYTRLQILSFERLAQFVVAEFGDGSAQSLNEQGRAMVLRALIGQNQHQLRQFRASARLPGFAQQLSLVFCELQQQKLAPDHLRQLSQRTSLHRSLRAKLHDLALLLDSYLKWLETHQVQDAFRQIDRATGILRQIAAEARAETRPPSIRIAGLWLDGFAAMTPQEMELLSALAPLCNQSLLAFCLEQEPTGDESWHSPWAGVGQTFQRCLQLFAAVPDCEISKLVLERDPDNSRFRNAPVLRHLEQNWMEPKPFRNSGDRLVSSSNAAGEISERLKATRQTEAASDAAPTSELGRSVQVFRCVDRDAEALMAAKEIIRHVRLGGRFRDAAVLVRNLESYHDPLRRAFRRYEIPFFMDRREPVAHHPLADLTRFALRTVTCGWKHEDLFGALKSGLVTEDEDAIDRLENEALCRGWEGPVWDEQSGLAGNASHASELERAKEQLLPPFHSLARTLASGQGQSTGEGLAKALRKFWQDLEVERQLETWNRECRGVGAGSHFTKLPVHGTVFDQMNEWLEDLARAFSADAISLRDWLPILEAGLSGLTVGVIPPAIDQVLVGSVDRSRNPELQLSILLGLNESVFPAAPDSGMLLSDSDRSVLERESVWLGPSVQERLGHELYLGYIACTRSSRRLVLSHAATDPSERQLSPSRFIGHVKRLFPTLQEELFTHQFTWEQSEHVSDLIAPTIQLRNHDPESNAAATLMKLQSLRHLLEDLMSMGEFCQNESLSERSVQSLYGSELHTSASRIEKFAECPFQFFVHSGLRAQERRKFETDARRLGSFQHELLKCFHDKIRSENRNWRDLTPAEARDKVRHIGSELARTFGDGVFALNKRSEFLARSLTHALETFVETTVGWLRDRNCFNPVAAELRFDKGGDLPPWSISLDGEKSLLFTGLIDRVDLWIPPGQSMALCVVLDYKSSAKRIDERMFANGLQLQLPAYLAALRHIPNLKQTFSVSEIVPAGVFYVNLRGEYTRGRHRDEVLADATARPAAYRHFGRFDAAYLSHLDQRVNDSEKGSSGAQFNYRLTSKGEIHKGCRDPLPGPKFLQLLDQVEQQLQDMGRRIFEGNADVDPYRHSNKTPCQRCDYRAICRIDPWTHPYRSLH